jgi:hypothetical protein
MKNANVSKRMARKLVASFGAALALAMVAGQASAVGVDTTAVLAGITDAQTAISAVITALLALSTAVFGIRKIQAFVSRRAGA